MVGDGSGGDSSELRDDTIVSSVHYKQTDGFHMNTIQAADHRPPPELCSEQTMAQCISAGETLTRHSVFEMKSLYQMCRVEEESGALRLDAYEQELGFRRAQVSSIP